MQKIQKLSIIIPIYNEEKTLEELVKKVLNVRLPQGIKKEIILINDASKDGSRKIIKKLASKNRNIRSFSNKMNLGKSQTVRKGILKSSGDFVIIQDADLEYNPEEIVGMIKLVENNDFDVVYGNRFGRKSKVIYRHYYLGNKFVSLFSNFFTYPRIRVWIPDMEVCYKLIRGDIARKLFQKLKARSSFGLEPEITAKLSRYKEKGKYLRFGVFPISYCPRTIEEGKHIRITDGLKALIEIVKYNVF